MREPAARNIAIDAARASMRARHAVHPTDSSRFSMCAKLERCFSRATREASLYATSDRQPLDRPR